MNVFVSLLALVFVLLFNASCSNSKQLAKGSPATENIDLKRPDSLSSAGNPIIRAEIVKKNFVMKNNHVTDQQEYYVRRSIQDYFIKFCEGNVTVAQLEDQLNRKKGAVSSVTMEVIFKEGAWDQCEENAIPVQSRIGPYVVIVNLIED